MTHSDDDGLIVPPKVAPLHVIVLPIIHKEEQRVRILEYCDDLEKALSSIDYHGRPIAVEIDTRELTGGEKAWSWVKKGVPVRIEVGMKEYDNQSVFMGSRDKAYKDRISLPRAEFIDNIVQQLNTIQDTLLTRARTFQKNHSILIDSQTDFYDYFQNGDAGFAYAHWNGDPDIEAKIKKDLNVTIRCIPLDRKNDTGICPFSGGKSMQRVLFARAY